MTSPRSGLQATLLLLLTGFLAVPLLAQERVALPEIREGATFHRTVIISERVETPERGGDGGTLMEARFQVLELREDGSGVLGVEPLRFRAEWRSSEGEDGSWDSATDPEPSEGPVRVPPDFVGHTFRVPFLAGGELDPGFFATLPESEGELAAIMALAPLIGFPERADGLPSGLPQQLEVGALSEPLSLGSSGSPPWARYQVVGIEEREGRLEALVEISGEMGMVAPAFDVPGAGATGQIRIDVEKGEVIESVAQMTRELSAGPDARHSVHFEIRTVPLH